MSWLFDGNEKVSPIHSEDEMMIGCSYQFLMDATYANATFLKGKKKDPGYTLEEALRETLKEHIEMVVENTLEEFEFCKEAMAKQLGKKYEER